MVPLSVKLPAPSLAVNQVKTIKGAEHVRWQALTQILLTWVYWRRPEAERAVLLAEAGWAQASVALARMRFACRFQVVTSEDSRSRKIIIPRLGRLWAGGSQPRA
jgi:hypothetical protein